jgi:hypothetical protein
MPLLEDVADGLARDAIKLADEVGDERVIDQIAHHIGTSSPTVEEAFRTAVRIRRAEQRAHVLMGDIRRKTAQDD